MKKKILSLVLAVLLVISISSSAFATAGFNTAVFDSAEDITVESDEMTNITTVSCTSLSKGRKAAIDIDWTRVVTIRPHISISSEMDAYSLAIYYVADSWLFIDSMIIKIGDHRYTISDFDTSRTVSNGSIQESIYLFMNNEISAMMQDLIAHQDEEIKVRLSGSKGSVDFTLTENIKNGMVNLYNIFVAGGGTSQVNMELAAKLAPVTVSMKE